jgi:hypothetical protein
MEIDLNYALVILVTSSHDVRYLKNQPSSHVEALIFYLE